MAKIGVITKFIMFSKYFDAMGDYFPDDEIKVYYRGDVSDGIELLDQAERDGCTALVTGAFTYEDIVDRTYLPIIDVEADFQDIINAWSKVKQRGEKPKKVAVFLLKTNPVLKYKALAEELSIVFDAEVRIVQFSTRSEYEPLIASLKGVVDLIIAGEKSLEVCRKYGIPNEFMEIGFNNKISGVEKALSIAHAEYETRARNKRLQEILNFSEEGIILADKKGKIVEYNRRANKILNVRRSIREQKLSVWEVLPESVFENRPKQLFALDNEIYKTDDKGKLMISSKLLEVGKETEGAIITIRETKEIEEIEKKIRKNVIEKGNTAKYDLTSIIGESHQINECRNLLKRFGRFDGNVLITGETGTGKELSEADRRLVGCWSETGRKLVGDWSETGRRGVSGTGLLLNHLNVTSGKKGVGTSPVPTPVPSRARRFRIEDYTPLGTAVIAFVRQRKDLKQCIGHLLGTHYFLC